MRAYLVVMDESEEAGAALRFASRRAARTGGVVHLLAIAPVEPFIAFGGLQATIEEEARARAEQLARESAGQVLASDGVAPVIAVRQGDAAKLVRDYLAEHDEVAALVLGAAREGYPGPLVAHFSGAGLGDLPCPIYIIPGSLGAEDIDRLS